MKILHVSKIVGENSKYNSWHSQSFWHHIMFMCSFCWEFIGNYFRYLKGKTTFGVKKWKYKVKNSFTWKWSELSEYLCQMDTGYLLENWWECSPDFLREKKKNCSQLDIWIHALGVLPIYPFLYIPLYH